MADITPILIKDLDPQTTLQDTDYFIVGGADAKKITVAQMKEALGINELNTEISNAPGFGRVYATTMSITADANSEGWAFVGPFDSAPYYPVAVIPVTKMYATSPICLTSAFHVKITRWDGAAVALPTTIIAFVLWAKI